MSARVALLGVFFLGLKEEILTKTLQMKYLIHTYKSLHPTARQLTEDEVRSSFDLISVVHLHDHDYT